MTVRQYIGARYVPRFVGLYDVTQSYEALDVVDNGSGTSYIAKKPTPAGTPLTDTNYWFLYGSTSGAIVNLQQQINDMKDSDVPGSLQNQIDDNTSDIAALTNFTFGEIPADGDEAVFIGDSFGDGIRNALWSLGFHILYYNNVGGAGFTNDGFLGQLNTLYSSVTNPDKVKYVFGIGGTNDTFATMTSALITNITTFCNRAKELFPNAKVFIGYVATHYNSVGVPKLIYKSFGKYCYIKGTSAAGNRCQFIDNLTENVSDCFRYISADRIHPNAAGYGILADTIINAIRGQSVKIPICGNLSQKTYSNTVDGITYTTTIEFHNGGGDPYIIVKAGTISSQAVSVANIYWSAVLIPPEEMPIMPMNPIYSMIQCDDTHAINISVSANGLRIHGSAPSDLGTYTIANMRDIKIDIPLF